MKNKDLFVLNTEQQKAFNRLKKAYADCKKLKVLLVNQYGTLHAYDNNLVEAFGDDEMTPSGNPIYYTDVKDVFIHNPNFISFVDSGRADDEISWMFGLTDKGLEIYNQELEKDGIER